jgi:hypothetical protein
MDSSGNHFRILMRDQGALEVSRARAKNDWGWCGSDQIVVAGILMTLSQDLLKSTPGCRFDVMV